VFWPTLIRESPPRDQCGGWCDSAGRGHGRGA